MRISQILLVVVAVIAITTATAHLSCIWLGPQCFEAQYAPPSIIESAKQGTLLAPLGTLVISAIFLLIAAYCFSAASILPKLPLLKWAVYAISFICIARGLLAIQLWIRYPERVDATNLCIAIVWLVSGVLLVLGYRMEIKKLKQ